MRRYARKPNGLGRCCLKKTGISVQHISNMENGHREPCLNNMAKLAKTFSVTLSEMTKGI